MHVQRFNDSIMGHGLTYSFAIPMNWPSLAYSTAVYNKFNEFFMFQMECKGKKRLLKKQFAQILQLPYEGSFEVLTSEQVLQMFNEMGYNPPISPISSFKKSNLSSVWNFFWVTLFFTGRSCGLDKAKLQFFFSYG